jgi:hypothetical protein
MAAGTLLRMQHLPGNHTNKSCKDNSKRDFAPHSHARVSFTQLLMHCKHRITLGKNVAWLACFIGFMVEVA